MIYLSGKPKISSEQCKKEDNIMNQTDCIEKENQTIKSCSDDEAATENNEDMDKIEDNSAITEDELKEQYKSLPMWQHIVLVILFLFGMTAVIMVIDFVVELITELLSHIF